MNYSELKEKHVFITGGANGIGAGLVEGFLHQGSKVSFVDLDEDACKKLIKRLKNTCVDISQIQYFPLDIQKIDKLQAAVKQSRDAFGNISVLINNAANDERHLIENTTVEDWDRLMRINLRPHFFSIQSVIKNMKKEQSGVVINLSSNACLLGLTGYPGYVTAKAGIIGLTKSMARELGFFNIRVNALLPGWVMTERQKKTWVKKKSLKECLDQQSLKKTIEVKDVVTTALFLASDSSRMITGQSIVVDGGRV